MYVKFIKSFLNFLGSNILYILWFIIYFSIAWYILGANLNSFIYVSIIYGVSITIALSPIGESILRAVENCRLPSTEQERNYLIPMFEEVYEDAKEVYPELNDGIRIYIMDVMYVNAFAIGRKTIAVTKGAMETFTAEELKGVLAHEFGHIFYGHTKALLLSVIGNFFFSVIVLFFRIVLYVIQIISNIVAQFNIVGLVFAIVTFVARLWVDLIIFIFINLSQIILALNSRTNEMQADTFAYEIGYGRQLISGMYLLQKVSMNQKLTISEQMKASHPHISCRIKNLEMLENQPVEGIASN